MKVRDIRFLLTLVMEWNVMNSRQFDAVVEYFMDLSPFDSEEERQLDAEAGASSIDEILRENANE